MSPISELASQDQSIWLDHLYKDGIDAPPIRSWIADGRVRGMLSSCGLRLEEQMDWLFGNPDLRLLAQAYEPPDDILKTLTVERIRTTADLFLPLFERTNGEDGLVCVAVDPRNYGDPQIMAEQTKQFWHLINRPNMMVSIPATSEGISVMREMLEEGVNIHATMVYSPGKYLEVVETYINVLEARLERGAGVEHIISVASFNPAQIDEYVDQHLAGFGGEGSEAQRASALTGHIGVAAAKLAHAQYKISFEDSRFMRLSEQGARKQRILWSAIKCDDNQHETMDYLEQLIGSETVLAMGLPLLQEVNDRKSIPSTLEQGLSEARGQLQALEGIGLSMPEVDVSIRQASIRARSEAYERVLEAVGQESRKRQQELGSMENAYRSVIGTLETQAVSRRIWQLDATLWSKDRREEKSVLVKLGWLELPLHAKELIEPCRQYVHMLRDDGISTMAFVASRSQAAFVQMLIDHYSDSSGQLRVLNPAEPDDLERMISEVGIQRMAFVIVADSPDERELVESVGRLWTILQDNYGSEPGNLLAIIAHPYTAEQLMDSGFTFRHAFLLPIEMPFHFSPLSYPGMIAAAWIGLELEHIIDGLNAVMKRCGPDQSPIRNPGLSLAAMVAAAVQSEVSPQILTADANWGPSLNWVEAFIADSGLHSKEFLAFEISLPPESISDRDDKPMVIYAVSGGDTPPEIFELAEIGIPVKILDLARGEHAIGNLVGLWSFAAAALGHIFGINPFNES